MITDDSRLSAPVKCKRSRLKNVSNRTIMFLYSASRRDVISYKCSPYHYSWSIPLRVEIRDILNLSGCRKLNFDRKWPMFWTIPRFKKYSAKTTVNGRPKLTSRQDRLFSGRPFWPYTLNDRILWIMIVKITLNILYKKFIFWALRALSERTVYFWAGEFLNNLIMWPYTFETVYFQDRLISRFFISWPYNLRSLSQSKFLFDWILSKTENEYWPSTLNDITNDRVLYHQPWLQ